MQITDAEKNEFRSFWAKQGHAIEGRISEETMRWFRIYTAADNIGDDFGQLRPGKIGQWDLYHNLTGEQSLGCDANETLIASGLTASEVAEAGRQEYYRQLGVDPDSAFEVQLFEQVALMGPDQLSARIDILERQLAGGDVVATT